jgi:hypothetical protein
MKSWDKVIVTNNNSQDAVGFTLFQIIQGNKLIDLVLEDNCGISWIDVKDNTHDSSTCYLKTVASKKILTNIYKSSSRKLIRTL